ncbi:MAG: response regulator [Fibrobacter sp.]|jgi:two-component system chemotaxis response regulator CheY|nr:response regulator [Fibrobacter sp.]
MIHRILIVDDSPVARKMLKSCLPDDREYEIREAGNGAEGVELYKKFSPDITFLDLTMPVMNGYKTIPEIRKINPDAMIIVLTADIQPKSIAEVISLGAFTLLKKPARKESIQDVIAQVELKINNTVEKI